MHMFSADELDSEFAEMLPERETLHFHGGNFNWANVYASNSSMALNVASLFANAQSQANQVVLVSQG